MTQTHSSRTQLRRAVLSSYLGSVIEYYDFLLYATASAVVFNKVFFSNLDPLVGTVASFGTLATGYFARPLGGVIFGHFGDRIGRKKMLVLSMTLMGVGSTLIGVLPTYAQVGVWAPILLVLLRVVQGVAVGGEWGGAVLMSLEHGAPERRGLNASWPQVGVPIGNLLAAGVLGILNLVLSEEAFLSWGWRVAFLLSGALVLVGLWIRVTIAESPLFAEVEETGAKARLPLVEVLKQHPKELLIAMGARIGTDVAFYTFTLYILTFITTNLGLPRGVGLNAVLIGSACQLALIPFFGALSDRVGRRPVYAAGAVASALWAFAFFPLLSTRSTVVIVLATIVALATHAAMYGPQAAFIAELFSTKLRYSGASMGYQIAGVLGGGIAPLVSIALAQSFGTPFAVSFYVLAMVVLTLVALAVAPETARVDLHDEPAPRR
jgi:metabolite-proton symporter